MATANLKIKVKTAWWLVPAVHVYAVTCRITGIEPSYDVLFSAVKRAIKVSLHG